MRTGAAVLVGQGAPGLVGIVAMPVIIANTGVEAFGLYSLVLSSQVIVAVSDLGLANTVLTEVPKALAAGDRERVSAVVRHALRLSFRVACTLALAAIVVLLAPVPWSSFTGIPASLDGAASSAFAALFLCSSLNVLGAVFLKLRQAEDRAAGAFLLQGLGVVVGGTMTIAAAVGGAGVPVLVLTTLGPPALARLSLAGGVRDIVSTPYAPSAASGLGKRAGFFAFMQIAAVLAYQVDQVLLGALTDLEEVARYALVNKPINAALLATGVVSTVLWPYLSSAVAQHDPVSIRRALRSSITLLSLGSFIAGITLLLAGDVVWDVLGQGRITPSVWLVGGFVAVLVLRGFDAVTSTFLNAIPVMGFQIRTATLVLVSNVAVSTVLIRRFGAAGAVWGTVLTQVPLVTVPYLFRSKRELQRVVSLAPTGATGGKR